MRDFKKLNEGTLSFSVAQELTTVVPPDPPVGISGAPSDNNIMIWNAVIFGYARAFVARVHANVRPALPVGVERVTKPPDCLLIAVSLVRPHDTPFEDGTFKLTLEFTEEYPNKPPTVRFVSKMFHPNGMATLSSLDLALLHSRCQRITTRMIHRFNANHLLFAVCSLCLVVQCTPTAAFA